MQVTAKKWCVPSPPATARCGVSMAGSRVGGISLRSASPTASPSGISSMSTSGLTSSRYPLASASVGLSGFHPEPPLKAGWHLETGNRPNDYYFLPPHIQSRVQKGYAVRRDYFDSRMQVVTHVQHNPKWAAQYEKYQAAASQGETESEAKLAFMQQFRVEKKKAVVEERWVTPPPSPGGHESVCRKCRDGGPSPVPPGPPPP